MGHRTKKRSKSVLFKCLLMLFLYFSCLFLAQKFLCLCVFAGPGRCFKHKSTVLPYFADEMCKKLSFLKDSTFSSLSGERKRERGKKKKISFVNTKVLRAAAEGESGCRDSHGLTAIQMTQSRSFGSHRKARSHEINAGVSTRRAEDGPRVKRRVARRSVCGQRRSLSARNCFHPHHK